MNMLEINDREFKEISSLVHDRFGINLTEKKRALVRGRLNKLIINLGFTSFSQYFKYVESDKTGKNILDMVDKISTNHSYFFRESDHFNYLSESVLPEIISSSENRRDSKLRIWCAGCANGQEAYTIAIVLREFFNKQNSILQPAILATDISVSALETAVKGHYMEGGLSGISPDLKRRYFQVEKDGSATVKQELKDMILFKRLNFMNDSFPFKNRFDIIFCRNVMIYFDKFTKEALVNKFHRYMLDRSWLFIGHSETLGRNNKNFRYIKPSTYLRVGAGV